MPRSGTGSAMYSVGTAIEFPAQHVMPGMEGPEGVLHHHDYRLEVVVEREDLDERGMVCDLDVLDAALQRIDDCVRGQNLDTIRPADAEAVTVEVFARWAQDELRRQLEGSGAATIEVRIFENQFAFGAFRSAVG